MDPTSLPGSSLEHGADRFLQPGVGVRNHKFHPAKTAGPQRAHELGLERLVLGVTNVEAEDFPAPVRGNTERDNNGLANDRVVHPGAVPASSAYRVLGLPKTISAKIRPVELRQREIEIAEGRLTAVEWRDSQFPQLKA